MPGNKRQSVRVRWVLILLCPFLHSFTGQREMTNRIDARSPTSTRMRSAADREGRVRITDDRSASRIGHGLSVGMFPCVVRVSCNERSCVLLVMSLTSAGSLKS